MPNTITIQLHPYLICTGMCQIWCPEPFLNYIFELCTRMDSVDQLNCSTCWRRRSEEEVSETGGLWSIDHALIFVSELSLIPEQSSFALSQCWVIDRVVNGISAALSLGFLSFGLDVIVSTLREWAEAECRTLQKLCGSNGCILFFRHSKLSKHIIIVKIALIIKKDTWIAHEYLLCRIFPKIYYILLLNILNFPLLIFRAEMFHITASLVMCDTIYNGKKFTHNWKRKK